MRAGLVVFQFGISIFFLIGTIVVDGQMDFLRSRPLGYERDHLVILPIFSLDHSSERNPEKRLMSRYPAIKQSFLEHPNILLASASSSRIPWSDGERRWVSVIEEGLPENVRQLGHHRVDSDFLRTLEVDLTAGRNLLDREPDDTSDVDFLVNQAAVQVMGSSRWEEDRCRRGRIVGVVRDFQVGSAGNRMTPLLLRIRSEGIPETIDFLQSRWQHYLPERPFRFTFLDDQIENAYRNERRLSRLFNIAALLAVLISCMGLIGLAAFTTEQRKKEVCIRKVLGASMTSILTLLTGTYLKLILIANLLAWPAAYFVIDGWLNDFDFRVALSPVPFFITAAHAFGLGLLAVSSQVLKSRSTDPIEALPVE